MDKCTIVCIFLGGIRVCCYPHMSLYAVMFLIGFVLICVMVCYSYTVRFFLAWLMFSELIILFMIGAIVGSALQG